MTDGLKAPIPAPAGPPIGFSILSAPQGKSVQISPAGELDLANIGKLQNELEKLIEGGFARIVIDLRRVEFLDSTALHALLSAHARAHRERWELAIIPGPRAVQRTFDITGTTDRLPFIADNGRVRSSDAREPVSLPMN